MIRVILERKSGIRENNEFLIEDYNGIHPTGIRRKIDESDIIEDILFKNNDIYRAIDGIQLVHVNIVKNSPGPIEYSWASRLVDMMCDIHLDSKNLLNLPKY